AQLTVELALHARATPAAEQVQDLAHRHSNRRASVGRMDAARQAGSIAAASATRISSSDAAAIVGGTIAVAPKGWARTAPGPALRLGRARAVPSAIMEAAS